LDLIVVPGLGFTRDGWRIGRGKGFYDTYIQRCADESKRKPQLIALAFSEQIYNEIPVDERDYKVDLVLFDN
jgi:5-formyltetrahydrofolate cyclo-ligase